MTLEIQASAAPVELLANDSRQPENRIMELAAWRSALAGELPKARLKRLLLAFYPALAGPGRYAFAAKVSQLEPADGKELFLQLHAALKRPEGDADTGWKRVLVALGASERELARRARQPVRGSGRSGRRHPRPRLALFAGRGGGDRVHARAPPAAALGPAGGQPARALRRQGRGAPLPAPRSSARERDREVGAASRRALRGSRSPSEVFEGRRAGREALWAWTVLTESA